MHEEIRQTNLWDVLIVMVELLSDFPSVKFKTSNPFVLVNTMNDKNLILSFNIFYYVKVSGFIGFFKCLNRCYFRYLVTSILKFLVQQIPYLGKECIEYASLILFWVTGIEFQNSELFLVQMAIYFILLKGDESTL